LAWNSIPSQARRSCDWRFPGDVKQYRDAPIRSFDQRCSRFYPPFPTIFCDPPRCTFAKTASPIRSIFSFLCLFSSFYELHGKLPEFTGPCWPARKVMENSKWFVSSNCWWNSNHWRTTIRTRDSNIGIFTK
jgi:hypothetical protein